MGEERKVVMRGRWGGKEGGQGGEGEEEGKEGKVGRRVTMV